MNVITRISLFAGLLRASAMDDCSWFIKTATDDSFCLTTPTSQYRQGLVMILAQCDKDNSQQKFRFDPFTYTISPADNNDWCLDFDFDDKKYRPLTMFKCGQTFSDFADDKHQRWLWPNYVKGEAGPLKNRGTGMCVGVGKDVYAGKYLQQYDCDDVSTFKFVEADKVRDVHVKNMKKILT